jgi:hypothetical protein
MKIKCGNPECGKLFEQKRKRGQRGRWKKYCSKSCGDKMHYKNFIENLKGGKRIRTYGIKTQQLTRTEREQGVKNLEELLKEQGCEIPEGYHLCLKK